MIEVGKCYQTISFNGTVYIFKIKDFTIHKVVDLSIVNKENEYYYINVEIGFLIENNDSGIKKLNHSIMKHIDTEFIEIEEKDMNKLAHYYKIMENSFNSIINNYEYK